MFWHMHSCLITVCMYSPAQHIRLHTSKNAGRFFATFSVSSAWQAGISVVIYPSSWKTVNARVVELADSLDSGSSVHSGRAGSSPASRTMIAEHYRWNGKKASHLNGFGNFLFSKFFGNSIDEITDGRGFEPLPTTISSMELSKNFENKKLPNPLRWLAFLPFHL